MDADVPGHVDGDEEAAMQGKDVIADAFGRVQGVVHGVVEGLTPSEISAFTHTLHKMYANLGKPHPNFDKPKRRAKRSLSPGG